MATTITPVLRSHVICAEVPDASGSGTTQLVFQVHRNALGLDPRVTVTATERPQLDDHREAVRRALQMGQSWLLSPQNTAQVIQLDNQRRSEAETKPSH
jgi:hypothetical protein